MEDLLAADLTFGLRVGELALKRRPKLDGRLEESAGLADRLEVTVESDRAGAVAVAEGREMAKLRRQMHQRMLGNGHCARPVELDCHFETICETCTFFVTTNQFRPTLQAQRDDAAAKGQLGRTKVFDRLLARLDSEAPALEHEAS